MIRIAVLLSGRHGRGSNMQAIADACADGRIQGRIVAVVGNFDSPALVRARDLGLPATVVPSPAKGSGPDSEDAYGEALRHVLAAADVDLICLAGYMRKVPSVIVSGYEGRIMNTHPALLPSFGGRGMYGANVHQAVLDYGAKVSGCTVHFVDESYDTGPVILQSVVPVQEDDTAETLAARVLVAEHAAFPQAVALFAQGRLTTKGRRVHIAIGDGQKKAP